MVGGRPSRSRARPPPHDPTTDRRDVDPAAGRGLVRAHREHHVRGRGQRAGQVHVATRPGGHRHVAGAAGQRVGAVAADQHVLAGVADQHIRAAATVQHVGPGIADQQIRKLVAGEVKRAGRGGIERNQMTIERTVINSVVQNRNAAIRRTEAKHYRG